MLIKFDDNFDQYLKDNAHLLNENSLEIKAISNLALSFRSGWHIIIGSLSLFETILSFDFVDSSTKSLFSTLIGQYTFQKSYFDSVDEYILIKNPDHNFVKNIDGSKTVYEVSINHFLDLNKCLKTVLVTEDDNDYEFYIKLTQKYIKENRNISNIGITFFPGNGGGANSYKSYERYIREGSMVLAIGDSDKAYPTADIGQTLKQLRRIYQKYKSASIIDLYELEVREKENLIPPSLYLIGINSSSKGFVEKLLQIEQLDQHREKLFFLDLKDGFEAGKFKKNQQLVEYYYSLFSDIQNLISCSVDEIEQKEDREKVMNGDGGIIEQFLTNVLGNGLENQLEEKRKLNSIPPQILIELEQNIKKKKNLFNNIPFFYEETLNKLCKKVFDWGCCKGDIFST
jgi:hypothetical protein